MCVGALSLPVRLRGEDYNILSRHILFPPLVYLTITGPILVATKSFRIIKPCTRFDRFNAKIKLRIDKRNCDASQLKKYEIIHARPNWLHVLGEELNMQVVELNASFVFQHKNS